MAESTDREDQLLGLASKFSLFVARWQRNDIRGAADVQKELHESGVEVRISPDATVPTQRSRPKQEGADQ